MKYSSEQKQIINAVRLTDKDLSVSAFAGTGKTTTVKGCIEALARKGARRNEILYLAYNRSMKEEAERKFGSLCSVMTLHGLAYRNYGYQMKDRLGAILPTSLIADKLRLPASVSVYDHSKGMPVDVSSQVLAGLIRSGFTSWCLRPDENIHSRLIRWDSYVGMSDVADRLAPILLPKLEEFITLVRTDCSIPITHDYYLKEWFLQNPQLPYKYIFLDEAQDANGIAVYLLLNQEKARHFWVGDNYQSLYEWRGAVNAMSRLGGDMHYLTHSFRFSDEIASVGNAVLGGLGSPVQMKGASSETGKVVLSDFEVVLSKSRNELTSYGEFPFDRDDFDRCAMLFPTNMDIIVCALWLEHLRLPYRIVSDKGVLSTVKAMHILENRSKGTGELSLFKDWESFVEFADSPEGGTYRTYYQLSKILGGSGKLYAFLEKAYSRTEGLTISTMHRAKGLEWDNVFVGGLRSTGSLNSPYGYEAFLSVIADSHPALKNNFSGEDLFFSCDTGNFKAVKLALNASKKSGDLPLGGYVMKAEAPDYRQLYVACTRARKSLYLSSNLFISPFCELQAYLVDKVKKEGVDAWHKQSVPEFLDDFLQLVKHGVISF